MKEGFPQFGASAKQGELGVSIVSRTISEHYGWLFKRNHQEHDFGIDGQIEVVTDDGMVTGQMLACQIKCGKSFFREKNRWGFVYRGETKHFNYLANYPIPVIIIICDPDSREAYWVQFQAFAARVTEAGWSLNVPPSNKLEFSKAELLSLLPKVCDMLGALSKYWDLNQILVELSLIVLMLDIADIKVMDLSWALAFFDRLRLTPELAYECQGKIEISVWGYDEDPRELFEVSEVRAYITRLDADLPDLFFFANTDQPTFTLNLFLFCTTPVSWETERSTPEVSRRVLLDDPEALPNFLERHFEGLNLISEWVGLSEDEIYRISMAVGKTLGCVPGVDGYVFNEGA